MKIIRLCAENVKRLKAIEIRPEGALVVIGGKNAAGKSSVLDSIAYALGGEKLCPEKPIRQGEEKARVSVELDNDMTVERTFTAKGSYLTVKNKDEFKAANPQKILDGLIGKLSFDPLAFVSMEPRKQLETLKNLVGLDFTQLDDKRAFYYEGRRELNKEAERFDNLIQSIPEADAPEKEVSVAELMAQLNQARQHNAEGQAISRTLLKLISAVEGKEAEIRTVEAHLALMKEQLLNLQEARQNANDECKQFSPTDESFIENQIAGAEEINGKVRQKKQRVEYIGIFEDLKKRIAATAGDIEFIDFEKEELLASAKFPIAGLGFGNLGITYNDIPFEQASSAEQLRVSVAMGLAMNPKLKVILIRDGSLLNGDNLKAIAEMAEKAEAQIWLEKCSDTGEGCSVIIEEGEVK